MMCSVVDFVQSLFLAFIYPFQSAKSYPSVLGIFKMYFFNSLFPPISFSIKICCQLNLCEPLIFLFPIFHPFVFFSYFLGDLLGFIFLSFCLIFCFDIFFKNFKTSYSLNVSCLNNILLFHGYSIFSYCSKGINFKFSSATFIFLVSSEFSFFFFPGFSLPCQKRSSGVQ